MNDSTNAKYRFLTDDRDGVETGLVFVTQAMVEAEGEKIPLWGNVFPSQDYRNAMIAWVAARRHLWNDWGQFAEREGGEAFSNLLLELTDAEPLRTIHGVCIQQNEDPRTITLSLYLGSCLLQPVLRHSFRTPRGRTRFVRWFHENDRFGWALAKMGMLDGASELAELIDDIATKPRSKMAA